MLGAITGAVGLLTSAAGGSVLKIIAGGLQNHFESKRALEKERHERKMAEKGVDIPAYYATLTLGLVDRISLGAVLWTRRLLALIVISTFCYIAIIWAHNPSTIITTFIPKEPGNISILWGLFNFPVTKDLTVEVSAGAIVWGLMDFAAFIIALYFTPTGKR